MCRVARAVRWFGSGQRRRVVSSLLRSSSSSSARISIRGAPSVCSYAVVYACVYIAREVSGRSSCNDVRTIVRECVRESSACVFLRVLICLNISSRRYAYHMTLQYYIVLHVKSIKRKAWQNTHTNPQSTFTFVLRHWHGIRWSSRDTVNSHSTCICLDVCDIERERFVFKLRYSRLWHMLISVCVYARGAHQARRTQNTAEMPWAER